MKIILSRKGFDSDFGGLPNPILPDGTLLSLPIPSDDTYKYSDFTISDKSYYEIINDLGNGFYKNRGKKIPITYQTACHLDPDIRKEVCARTQSWRGIFGQTGSPQSHLTNQGVSAGDLFLFFGTFRETELVENRLQYKKYSKARHIIYGYLKIGEILELSQHSPPKWAHYHPHINNPATRGKEWKNNTLYISADSFFSNSALPGFGTFKYSKNLELTKADMSKSYWNLPLFFKNINISFHSEKSWHGDVFKSVGRGQEFVFDVNDDVEEWLRILFVDTGN